jgi:hypothetical protein
MIQIILRNKKKQDHQKNIGLYLVTRQKTENNLSVFIVVECFSRVTWHDGTMIIVNLIRFARNYIVNMFPIFN